MPYSPHDLQLIEMKPEDREALLAVGRRFTLLSLVIFVALLGSIWVTSLLFPSLIGELTGFTLTYVVIVSAIGALTFGGLYSVASVLRPRKREDEPV